MPTLIIDGKEIDVKPGTSIMEAARKLGISIPHFCWHPKLPVAGNCRMCMVEVEKMPKPVVACAMPVGDGMVVKTQSPMALDARKGVMEFLLINHPLDCPVCDQGGECDLQDLAMKYGPDRSRFCETKRQVPDKDLGPLIETVMNRCIHCTRCIRYSTEIAGVEEMGAVYRGDHMAVGPFVEKTLSSEMAGNMAELCPVGALNLKPFHYQARGWELKRTEGICGHCAVGCHLRRDHLGGQVKRVMASSCDAINEVWLCDKGRFSYDGLAVERLRDPTVRRNQLNPTPVNWQEALDRAAELLKGVKPEETAGLAGDDQGAEELFAFQDLLRRGVGTPHVDHRLRQRDFSGDAIPLTRADLLMNTPLVKLPTADLIVLVGCDPRHETPLLNLRVRKAALNGATVISVNPRKLKHNLPGLREMVLRPGAEIDFLDLTLEFLKHGGGGTGDAGRLAAALHKAKRPAVILGDYAIQHPSAERLRRLAAALLDECNALGGQWNGFNRVSSRANAAAAQDLGVVPHRGPGYAKLEKSGHDAGKILKAAASGEIKVLFLLGCDPLLDGVDANLAREAMKKAKVIYLGSHRTPAADLATVVLPGLAISEKEVCLTNAEGRVQVSRKAVDGPVEAKEDWRILRALSDRFAQPLPYNTVEALRQAMAAADHRYQLSALDGGEMADPCDHSPVTIGLPLGGPAEKPHVGLTLVGEHPFYQGDGVARRSATLNRLDPGPHLRLNPAEATKMGVAHGQRVRVVQGDRTLEGVAALDPLIPEGTLFAGCGYEKALAQELIELNGGFPAVSLVGL
ncbi:MAG: NADH-quinone oxidoreductase subunit NuoG [Magnetococcales bacterium]|nr:NADH-quinone oxidoreductase subunit NuoG [Magnetococcales bacterium]